jgi:hypothetical protein
LAYRLKQIDRDGVNTFSSVISIFPNEAGRARVMEVYPLPLTTGSSQASFRFNLDVAGSLSLHLHDALGRSARTLIEGYFDAGEHGLTCEVPKVQPGTWFLTLSVDGRHLRTQAVQIVR